MPPKPLHRVVAAVIEDDGRYLITQRRKTASLPLLWEFPGGKVQPGETDAEALVREVELRIGVTVEVRAALSEREHSYADYDVHLQLFDCHVPDGAMPRPVRVADLRWVPLADLDQYEFPPVDQASMDKLLGRDCN